MFWPFRRRERTLGEKGETIAKRHLRRAGMKVLATNYRCPAGEADLIMLDPASRKTHGAETVAFVEVKTRSSDRYVDPESAVDEDKRRQVRRVADYYLRHHDAVGFVLRFDVVSVVIRDGNEPILRHTKDAF
jgi:putative endonuclease